MKKMLRTWMACLLVLCMLITMPVGITQQVVNAAKADELEEFLSVTETEQEPETLTEEETQVESESPIEPESPVESEILSDPEITTEPESTADPETPIEPETTAETEISVEPEGMPEPEITVEPETTTEQEDMAEYASLQGMTVDEDGNGVAGVIVTASGIAGETAIGQTDASGYWQLSGLFFGETYTLTFAKENSVCMPESMMAMAGDICVDVTVIPATTEDSEAPDEQEAQNSAFHGIVLMRETNAGVGGVLVSAQGAEEKMTRTDENGVWHIEGLPVQTASFSFALEGYTFEPETITAFIPQETENGLEEACETVYASFAGKDAALLSASLESPSVLSLVVSGLPETMMAETAGITIQWNAVNGASTYVVIMEGPIKHFSENISGTQYTLPVEWLAVEGDYTLRVNALGEQGEYVLGSTASAFKVQAGEGQKLASPVLNADALEMQVGKSVTVTWNAVEGAEYYICQQRAEMVSYNAERVTDTIITMYISHSGENTLSVIACASDRQASDTAVISVVGVAKGKLENPVFHEIPTQKVNTEFTISWDPVENAEYYIVSMSDGTWFDRTEEPDIVVPVGTFTETGSYRIQVSAYADGYESSYAYALVSIDDGGTERLPAPQNLRVFKDYAVRVTWDDVEGAEGYRVSCNDNVITQTECEIQLQGQGDLLSHAGTYTVSVSAFAVGKTAETATATFTIDASDIPGKPELDVPVTHPIGQPLSVSWNAVENAEFYFLSLSGPSGETIWSDGTDLQTSVTIPAAYLSQAGTYRLYLDASSNCGIRSFTSATFTITEAEKKLDAPVINEITAQVNVDCVISWNAVPNAESYLVQVSIPAESSAYPLTYSETVTTNSYMLSQYFIRTAGEGTVTVTAAAEGYTAGVSTKSFAIIERGKLSVPQNLQISGLSAENTLPTNRAVIMTWSAVENATGYHIEMVKGSNSAISAKISSEPFISFDSYEFASPDTYTVTIKANASGYLDSDGAVITFTTVADETAPLPAPASITVPEGPFFSDTAYTFSWAPVEGADSYIVRWICGYNTCITSVMGGSSASIHAPVIPETAGSAETILSVTPAAEGRTSTSKELTLTVYRSAKLDTPVLTCPDSVETSTAFNVNWTTVDNATQYFLEIRQGETSVWNKTAYTGDPDATGITVPASLLSVPGAYTLNVTAQATGFTDATAEKALTVTGTSGALNALNITNPGTITKGEAYTLEWNAVENAAFYTLEIGQNGETILWQDNLTQNSFTVPVDTHTQTGLATLIVTAQAPGYAGVSAMQQYDVQDNGALEKPLLSVPTKIEEGKPLTIHWNFVEHAAEYSVLLQREDNQYGLVDLHRTVVHETSVIFDSSLLKEGNYKVQVTARAPGWHDGISDIADFSVILPFSYAVSNGRATVTGYSGAQSALTVPDMLGGYPVVAIGDNAFRGNTVITSVTLPDMVESIGASGFENCTSLESLTGLGVTSVGERAFAGCVNLTHLQLGSNTIYGENALLDTPFDYTIADPSDNGYQDNDKLINITIAEGVIEIPAEAFKNCSNLQTVNLPKSLQVIGSRAFANCASLTSVTIYEDCESIAGEAFNDAGNFTVYIYQRDVTHISSVAQYAIDHNISYVICQWPETLAVTATWPSNLRVTQNIPATFLVEAAGASKVELYVDGESKGEYAIGSTGSGSFQYAFTELGDYKVYLLAKSGSDYGKTETKTVTVVAQPAPAGFSFIMGPNPVATGENVGFFVTAPGAKKIRLVVDGVEYEEYAVTDDKAAFSRAFTQEGERSVQFKALINGAWSDPSAAQTLTVLAQAQLGSPVVTVSEAYVNESFEVSWTAVEHATQYTVYLYKDGKQVWKGMPEAGELKIIVPGSAVPQAGTYSVDVYASAAGYSQNNGSAQVQAKIAAAELLTVKQGNNSRWALEPVGSSFPFTITTSLHTTGVSISGAASAILTGQSPFEWTARPAASGVHIYVFTPMGVNAGESWRFPVYAYDASDEQTYYAQQVITVFTPNNSGTVSTAGTYAVNTQIQVNGKITVNGQGYWVVKTGDSASRLLIQIDSNALKNEPVETVITEPEKPCENGAHVLSLDDSVFGEHPHNSAFAICSICGAKVAVGIGVYAVPGCELCQKKTLEIKGTNPDSLQYITALKDVAPGENPLENAAFVNAFVKILRKGNVPYDKIQEIQDCVKKAPETYRDLYLYSLTSYDIWGTNAKDGSYFQPSENNIRILASNTGNKFLSTWFHESGHAIDYNAGSKDEGHTSKTYAGEIDGKQMLLVDVLRNDVLEYVKGKVSDSCGGGLFSKKLSDAQIDDIVDVFVSSEGRLYYDFENGEFVDPIKRNPPEGWTNDMVAVYKEAAQSMSNAGDDIFYNFGSPKKTYTYISSFLFCDMLEGFTNYKVNGNVGHKWYLKKDQEMWGFMKNYWYEEDGLLTGNQCLEAWAEYFSAMLTGYKPAQDSNAACFPEACELMDQMAKEMLENYKEQFGR